MRQVKSCGVLLFRRAPEWEFLLLVHPNRLDLPKGHQEGDETEHETARREVEEETGLAASAVTLDPEFRFAHTYRARYARFGDEEVEKTLVVFLGRIDADEKIIPSEHGAYEWHPWQPPHTIQEQTIDPLLAAVAAHGLDGLD